MGDARAASAISWPVVAGIAIAQLVAWGTLYYAFAVIVQPMSAELGWSKAGANGAISVGLAIAGLCAFPVGRWIDARGGRGVMILGAALALLMLLLWSQVHELWQLYAVWVGIGVASAMVLYEPAFAVVARLIGSNYRRVIAAIAIVGGLASTVYIPLTDALVDNLGWRQALLVLACIMIPVCIGVPLLLLPRHGAASVAVDMPNIHRESPILAKAIRTPVFWLLVASFVAFALLYTSLLFHLIPILKERGFGETSVIALYAMIGPSQVAGRVVLFALEKRLSISAFGLLATALPVLALLMLINLVPGSTLAVGFPIAFGIGMGIKTVVQATAAPEFLGRAQYGALQGAITLPSQLAQAAAPFLAALIFEVAGSYDLVLRMLLACAVVSAVAFAAAIWLAGQRKRETEMASNKPRS